MGCLVRNMGCLIGHWTSQDGWEAFKAHQRKEDGVCITTGSDFQKKTREFSLYKHDKGALFPQRSRLGALVSDVSYGIFVIPHSFFTGIGNVGSGLVHTAIACKDLYKNWNEKGFSIKEAFTPAGQQFFGAIKKGIIVGLIYGATRYDLPINGWKWAALGAIGLWSVCSAYNPLGTMRTVDFIERNLNVRPLTDGQVSDLSWPKTCVHILDGSYSLSRLLYIHRVGNISDPVGDEKKFEKVKEE